MATPSSLTTLSPFAVALRAAIDARGITLARLHERLAARGNPVSVATLSYWRSGARRPEGAQSLAAIADIEDLLGLATDALAGLLGPTNRTGPLGPSAFPFEEELLEQRVKETFEAMGAVYPDPTRELTVHSVTDVGPGGRVLRRTTRAVVQATSGTVAAIPFVEITPGDRTPSPHFEAIGGGHIATTFSHPSEEVHGVLFALDRPITSPASTLIEWAVVYPEGFPATDGTGHGISLQARELLVWTRFAPDSVPDWYDEIEETPSGEEVTPRSFDGATSAFAVRRNFGPGSLSIQWGYGPRPTDLSEG